MRFAFDGENLPASEAAGQESCREVQITVICRLKGKSQTRVLSENFKPTSVETLVGLNGKQVGGYMAHGYSPTSASLKWLPSLLLDLLLAKWGPLLPSPTHLDFD